MPDNVHKYLKSAVKGSVQMIVGMSLGTLLWFAAKVLIVNNTTTDEFGIYSLALAVISFITMFASAGLQDGSTRYISMFLHKGDEEEAHRVTRSVLLLSLIFGGAASLGCLIAAGPISKYVFYKPELALPLRIISGFAMFSAMSGSMVGVIRGFGDIRPRVYFIYIAQPLFFICLVWVTLKLKYSYLGILAAFAVSMFLCLLSIGLYGQRKFRINPLSVIGGTHLGSVLRFSLPLLGAATMGVLLTWTDTLMLGRYATTDDVSSYSIALSLAKLMTFAVSAIGFVFMPIAGELYAKGQNDKLKRVYQILTKWSFLATLPVFFVMFFFPEMTITFLFGERYLVSSTALMILSAGFLSTIVSGTNSSLLMIMGKSRIILNVSIFEALLNIILNYVFIKRLGFGIIGASSATTISLVVSGFLRTFLIHKISRIHPITMAFAKPIAASAIVGAAVYAAAKSLPLHIWILPLYLLVFFAAYFALLLVLKGIEQEDLDLLSTVTKKAGVDIDGILTRLSRFTGK